MQGFEGILAQADDLRRAIGEAPVEWRITRLDGIETTRTYRKYGIVARLRYDHHLSTYSLTVDGIHATISASGSEDEALSNGERAIRRVLRQRMDVAIAFISDDMPALLKALPAPKAAA